jgi:hypothetical protein
VGFDLLYDSGGFANMVDPMMVSAFLCEYWIFRTTFQENREIHGIDSEKLMLRRT